MATVMAVVRKHAGPGVWSRGELAKFVPLNCEGVPNALTIVQLPCVGRGFRASNSHPSMAASGRFC